MQQTSIDSYLSVQDKLPEIRGRLYRAISSYGPINNRQLADRTGIAINTVTPQVLRLRKDGKVELSHKEHDPVSGQLSMFWRVTQ